MRHKEYPVTAKTDRYSAINLQERTSQKMASVPLISMQ